MATANLIRNLDDLPAAFEHAAVTIGNFDGVHRGHAVLIERLTQLAGSLGGPSIVFTFDPHPAQLLYPQDVPPALTPTARKAELLAELGVDLVVAYPTDQAVLSLTPDEFFQHIICDRLQARAMVEGPNFYFGRRRCGTIDHLRAMCENAGIRLEVVEPLRAGTRYVSSSWIRELIQAGEVAHAAEWLTQPYRVHGRVVQGAGRGAKLGFPTANIEPLGMVLPPLGVYAGRAVVGGHAYAAAAHIGPNPTFAEQTNKFEVHLLAHDGAALYGQSLEFDFFKRLRDVRSFDDVDALLQQLRLDIAAVRQIVDL